MRYLQSASRFQFVLRERPVLFFGDNCEVVFGASDTAKNTQELRSHIAAEILSFNGGQNGRNIKHFGSFCQSNRVVDQQLAIDGGNAKSHLRLLVYKNDG